MEDAVSWKDTLADLSIKDRLEHIYLKKLFLFLPLF